MSVLRGLLFDNLGLKLAALLLAVLVYLNVYLDRPASMIVSFPLELHDLADSLSLSGPVPAAVQAELRGTGKQLLRLRVTEPPLKLSLAGVGAGRFERAMTSEDLPLSASDLLQADRLVGPRTLELQIERKMRREVPVALRVEGLPGSGAALSGPATAEPGSVVITGPARVVAKLDSVVLLPARIGGRRDSVRVQVAAEALPDWCVMEPPLVKVTVPLKRLAP